MGPTAHISLNPGLPVAEKSFMRLLQLSFETDDSAAIDLHPMLSVVQGLDERMRARLVATVTAVAAGATPPCRGVVEAHGVRLPLDEANLALLDVGGDHDPVVRRSDLPGAIPEGPEHGGPGSNAAGADPVAAILEATDAVQRVRDGAGRGDDRMRERESEVRGREIRHGATSVPRGLRTASTSG